MPSLGAWVIHVVLILLGKILLDVIPGMRQDASWTIVNLGYIAVSMQTEKAHACPFKQCHSANTG